MADIGCQHLTNLVPLSVSVREPAHKTMDLQAAHLNGMCLLFVLLITSAFPAGTCQSVHFEKGPR